jgi:cytochrome bd ubiquinol oxidase subunit II
VVAGLLSLALLIELHSSNRLLYDRLTHRSLALVIIAALCGLISIALSNERTVRHLRTRWVAALGVAAVIWAWGVAQYPVLLPRTSITLTNGGAPPTTLDALFVVFLVAVVLQGPAFLLLCTMQSRRMLGTDDAGLSSASLPEDH